MFVGRDRELTRIETELNAGRVVTLHGPEGVGKSHLAVEAAQRLRPRFSDGVVMVHAPQESDLLTMALADALDLSFGDINGTPLDRLSGFLRHRQMLIMVDGVPLDAADMLDQLVTAAPGLRLLVTASERLLLPNESAIRVGGVAAQAVYIFEEVARSVDPGFTLEANRAAVDRLCDQLEGNPLAVELLAAWADVTPPTEVDLPPGAPLKAVLTFAWERLTHRQGQALASASLFRGAFSWQAAEYVTTAPRDVLETLATRRLIRVDGEELRMHPSVASFSQARIENLSASRDRHCTYFAELMSQQGDRLKGAEQADALRTIDHYIADIRAAWEWATSQTYTGAADMMLEGLWFYYELRGLLQEGATRFGEAVHRLRADPETQAKAEARAGWFHYRLGDYFEARQALERSLAVAQERHDEHEEAFAMDVLGCIGYYRGHYEEAQGFVSQALDQRRDIGDRWGEAVCLNNLGVFAAAQGRDADARALHEESLSVKRELGDPWLIIYSLNALASIEQREGNLEAAKTHLKEAMTLCQQLNYKLLLATMLNNLGHIERAGGSPEEAASLYQQSAEMAASIGERQAQAAALDHLGHLSAEQGDHAAAYKHHHEALALAYEVNAGPVALSALVGLAATMEDADRAVTLLALALKEEATRPEVRAHAKRLLTELQASQPADAFQAAVARGERSYLRRIIAGELGITTAAL